jgi:hypothetical protein
MEGHYAGTLAVRARAADMIVVLTPPRLTCVLRLIWRGLRDRGRGRYDLAPGCREQVPDWAFLREAWAFEATELPAALHTLTSPAAVRADGTWPPVAILRTAAEIERFVRDVRA